jgi:hypothetical protein
MYICSIDPGIKNFAVCIENVDSNRLKEITFPINCYIKQTKNNFVPTQEYLDFLNKIIFYSNTVMCENIDISMGVKMKNSKDLSDKILLNLKEYLESQKTLFDKCDIIIIEKQMSFRGRINPMAIKIAHFCYSWFLINYGEKKKLVDFMAYNKTQVMGAPNKLTKAMRKKWSSDKCVEIWNKREDQVMIDKLKKIKKKDDIGDTLLMCLAYIIMNFFK